MVTLGFLRVPAHPRVFDLIEGETPWAELKALSIGRAFTGNDLPDAWRAAKVRHQHLKLATFDKGFKKMLRPSMLTLLS